MAAEINLLEGRQEIRVTKRSETLLKGEFLLFDNRY